MELKILWGRGVVSPFPCEMGLGHPRVPSKVASTHVETVPWLGAMGSRALVKRWQTLFLPLILPPLPPQSPNSSSEGEEDRSQLLPPHLRGRKVGLAREPLRRPPCFQSVGRGRDVGLLILSRGTSDSDLSGRKAISERA